MSKVAAYLQGHIAGEVTSRIDIRKKYASSSSVLHKTPELVIAPRTTNDVRKIARFAWQLAEKGHKLGITPRGAGTDPTGGSVTDGILLNTRPYLTKVYEYDQKQQLLRVQPGVTVESINAALGLHQSRLAITAVPPHATVGGSIGFGEASTLGRKSWIDRLEVVLDNGDVIQTGVISKREFNKRRGMQGREGDIYRGVDTVLENHADLIARLQDAESADRSGYPGICNVEGKNGDIDLTPLFLGSQGTLGIITEMIVRAEYAPEEHAAAAIMFKTGEDARDAIDEIDQLRPTTMEYIDGRFVAEAIKQGNSYKWLEKLEEDVIQDSTLVVVTFDVFKGKKRAQLINKLSKMLDSMDCIYTTNNEEDIDALSNVLEYSVIPTSHADGGAPVIMPGFYVPVERFEEFMRELTRLENQLNVDLPLHGQMVAELYTVMPTFDLTKTADKQRLFKVLDALAALVASLGGVVIARGSEGRLLSRFVRSEWSDEYEKMMDDIREVFDPHGILNPGVKQKVELKDLVGELRGDNIIYP